MKKHLKAGEGADLIAPSIMRALIVMRRALAMTSERTGVKSTQKCVRLCSNSSSTQFPKVGAASLCVQPLKHAVLSCALIVTFVQCRKELQVLAEAGRVLKGTAEAWPRMGSLPSDKWLLLLNREGSGAAEIILLVRFVCCD